MEQFFKIDHVSKIFVVKSGILGQPKKLLAVDDVSLALESGECLGLVGESGCGKSTLGKIASGLLKADCGSVRLRNKELPVAGASSWQTGKIQMVFQDPASSLDPRMTVLASIREPLQALGLPKAEQLLRANELMDAVGLEGMGARYPHQFSGGQRQRIAVARALATKPDVVVCDEPVSALDASVQAQILNLLKDMQQRHKAAYLFISHDLAVTGFMCARIMVMYLGQIVEAAARDELFAHAAHPYSRALLASMPQGRATWKRERGAGTLPPPMPGELPSPFAPPSGCHFHPRCPNARPICSTTPPPWRNLAPGWRARCHFAGEI